MEDEVGISKLAAAFEIPTAPKDTASTDKDNTTSHPSMFASSDTLRTYNEYAMRAYRVHMPWEQSLEEIRMCTFQIANANNLEFRF